MQIEEALKIIEQAQKTLTLVSEEALELTSDEGFKDSIDAAINLLGMAAEDLAEGLENVDRN